MLVAGDAAGLPVRARVAQKGQSYWCRDCQTRVILRRGVIRVPHFAHRPGAPDCPGAHETAEHMEMKDYLYQVLSTQRWVSACALEHPLGTDPRQRADVWAMTPWGPIAFECQASSLGLRDLQQKLRNYTEQGIYCFYLLHRNLVPGRSAPPLEYVAGQKRRIPMWVLGLHELYGAIYVYESQPEHNPQIFALQLTDLVRFYCTKRIEQSRPISFDEVTCAWRGCGFAGLTGRYTLALFADPSALPPARGWEEPPLIWSVGHRTHLPAGRPGQLSLPFVDYTEAAPPAPLAPRPLAPPSPSPFAGIPVADRGNPPAVCPSCGERQWAWKQGWYCSRCNPAGPTL